MRTLLAAFKVTAFVVATLTLYWGWWLTHFFVPNKVYWRQVAFGLWTKSFVWTSQMKVKVIGTPPKPPFFLVTNHLSYSDIAAIRSVVTGVFVAKGEIQGWFLAGRICRDMGTIFVDRENRRDIPRAGELIMERLNAGEGVVVFPEGRSTKGERVERFHSSFFEFAVEEKLPVSYASISYSTPPGELEANLAACWWEDISFFAHLWRLMHVREYTATITFGENPVEGVDRKQLASKLHDLVEASFAPVL